jgi:hypothetical protein
VERERHAAEALDSVAQEQGAAGAGDLGDLLDGLNGSDLVVDEHGRDDAGAVGDALHGEVEIDEAVGCHREDFDLGAEAAEPFGGVEHGGVLGGEGDDAAAFGGQAGERALERPVERSVAPEVKWREPLASGVSRLRST